MDANQLIAEYEVSDDRTFRRKYAGYIRSWMTYLSKPDDGGDPISNHSIKVMVGVIASFFKYNDLPLGHIPQATNGIIYHNRDITKDEILQIMTVSKIRESAFFAVMAQSGLRPYTIKQLRLKNIESFEKIPCMIQVPKEIAKGKFGSYVTFIGADAVKYLKQYFATRSNLNPNSLLFCSSTDENKPISVKSESSRFRYSAQKLEKIGALKFEIRKNKPSELRLYNLRKFFRKYANQMGFENVNYLMGHTVRGSDENYKPQDPEFYRALYAEKAMPFLRIDAPTPTETNQLVNAMTKQHEAEMDILKKELKKRDEQIQALNDRFSKYELYFKMMEDKFKPNPTKAEIQTAESLLPGLETVLYDNPDRIAEIFLSNSNFLELLTSRISPEEMAKAEKLAKEQNVSVDEIIKKKLIEIIKEEVKLSNSP
jgi:integrase